MTQLVYVSSAVMWRVHAAFRSTCVLILSCNRPLFVLLQLRAQAQVLKKAVADEQAKNAELKVKQQTIWPFATSASTPALFSPW